MRLYQAEHRFYGGVDLHARTMYLCITDPQGAVVFHKNLDANPQAFREAIAPFKDGLVVACECLFAWYWLADLCTAEGIPFVLGHALEMKAIHGTKTKNDRIDAEKIAHLLRANLLPQAYVYPAAMRATRDLLRRRNFLVRRRAGGRVIFRSSTVNTTCRPSPRSSATPATAPVPWSASATRACTRPSRSIWG